MFFTNALSVLVAIFSVMFWNEKKHGLDFTWLLKHYWKTYLLVVNKALIRAGPSEIGQDILTVKQNLDPDFPIDSN